MSDKGFQSTLPRGSDDSLHILVSVLLHFNPRSLAGATVLNKEIYAQGNISIHAPSRERRQRRFSLHSWQYFNPRSLAGATYSIFHNQLKYLHFNPRSLAGATRLQKRQHESVAISIHAPSRERQHQNKLLLYSFKSSIFCELAQLKYSKIYFDVRKLIVSHSSLSCEPKLNFMFHITSHRIILHYFYSCQSICK